MVCKIVLTLFTKGQAATPAWNTGRFAAVTSPAAASSAAAAATEGENSAILTSAKCKKHSNKSSVEQKGQCWGVSLGLRCNAMALAREGVGGARTGLGAEEDVDGARLDGGDL